MHWSFCVECELILEFMEVNPLWNENITFENIEIGMGTYILDL